MARRNLKQEHKRKINHATLLRKSQQRTNDELKVLKYNERQRQLSRKAAR